MDVSASSVVSGSQREGEKGTSWTEVGEKTARSSCSLHQDSEELLWWHWGWSREQQEGQELLPSSCRVQPHPPCRNY